MRAAFSMSAESAPTDPMLEILAPSTFAVVAAEIGDKTQLLALCLAARFHRPVPIITGILAATILNHGFSSLIGLSLAAWLTPDVLRWVLVVSFAAMAAWMLVPDEIEDNACERPLGRFGIFGTTFILFFLAEIGDKTQLATVALGAHYGDALAVTAGTTLGMLIADVPAIFVGNKLSEKLNPLLMRRIAAVIFALFAVFAYLRM